MLGYCDTTWRCTASVKAELCAQDVQVQVLGLRKSKLLDVWAKTYSKTPKFKERCPTSFSSNFLGFSVFLWSFLLWIEYFFLPWFFENKKLKRAYLAPFVQIQILCSEIILLGLQMDKCWIYEYEYIGK